VAFQLTFACRHDTLVCIGVEFCGGSSVLAASS
jgi:hypothetical protein